MQVGVHHLGRSLGEYIRTQHNTLELLDVDGIEPCIQDAQGTLLVGGQRLVGVAVQGVYLGNHGLVVRGDKLGAVVEIGLEAVIVCRVVGSGEHHAGIGIQLADGKGNFRCGAGTVEQGAVAAQVGGNLSAILGEIAGEVARVVAYHNHRLAAGALGFHEAAHIGDETTHGAAYVEIVHAGRAHAGELRTAIHAALALLCDGHHRADGAATQTTGTEGQCLVESVVDFGPFTGFHQLLNGGGNHRVLGAAGQQLNILQGGLQQLAFSHGLLQCINNSCIHTWRAL